MSQFGVSFGNEIILTPGAYARLNADAMTPERRGNERAVAVIAVADGGSVGQADVFSSLNAANRRLVGGVGYDLTSKVFNPGGGFRGASQVIFIRVNKAVAASINAGDVIFRASNPGPSSNSIRVRRTITAGVANLYVEDLVARVREQYLNLGPVLAVRYQGGAGSPSVAVSASGGVTTVTLTGSSTLTITSNQARTVGDLYQIINDSSEWSADYAGSLGSSIPITDLVTGTVTASGGVYTLSIGARAYLYALADSSLITAELPASPASPVDLSAWAFLSGGTNGPAVVLQDWLDAFEIADTYDLHGIVVGTGDEQVLAAAMAHVTTASSIANRRERLLYCGVALSTSKTDLGTKLNNLRQLIGGARAIIAGQEPVEGTRRYPTYYLAAMAAGIKAGSEPAMSLLNKPVGVQKLSYQYTPADYDSLFTNGFLAVRFDSEANEYRFANNRTSYVADANVIYGKVSGMDIHDTLLKGVRKAASVEVGQVADQSLASRLRSRIVAYLDSQVRGALNPSGVLTPGVGTDGRARPAFENVELVFDGFDAVRVRFEAHPVGEAAYILVEGFLTPVRLVAR